MTDAAPKIGNEAGRERDDIRPFRVGFSDLELAELRRRIKATRWPERELVDDASQGVQLSTAQQLAQYWSSDYNWRKCEATSICVGWGRTA